jgi:hypothetical protein
LLLRANTVQVTLAGSALMKPPERKPPKGGQTERLNREEHVIRTRSVKIFHNVGDVEKNTAGL